MPGRTITIRLPSTKQTLFGAFIVLLLAVGLLLVSGRLSALWTPKVQTPPFVPPNAQLASKSINARVEELLSRMSLQDEIGQLNQYSAGAMTGPTTGARLDPSSMSSEPSWSTATSISQSIKARCTFRLCSASTCSTAIAPSSRSR